MRICLFESRSGGHYPIQMRRVAEALLPDGEVMLVAPAVVLEDLADLRCGTIDLGDPKPRPGDPGFMGFADQAGSELDRISVLCAGGRFDHLIHLDTDSILRWWIQREPMKIPAAITILNATGHLRSLYGSELTLRERAKARYLDQKIRRWRRRPDANAILTFDREAARIWDAQEGAATHWMPERPVRSMPADKPTQPETDCILYGYLESHKGLDLLAAALAEGADGLRVRIAGEVRPSYRRELERHIETMRRGGVIVSTRLERLTESEAIGELAAARCTALPYPRQMGVGRVVMESAAAGTPVVTTSFGTMGHRVRGCGIGIAVEPTDRDALRSAVLELSSQGVRDSYGENLAAYVEEFTTGFREQIRATVGLAP